MNSFQFGDYKWIGEQVRKIRKERKISAKGLGAMVGVSGQAIAQYERGERKPDLNMLKAIANALECEESAFWSMSAKENYLYAILDEEWKMATNGESAAHNEKERLSSLFYTSRKANIIDSIIYDIKELRIEKDFDYLLFNLEKHLNQTNNPKSREISEKKEKILANNKDADIIKKLLKELLKEAYVLIIYDVVEYIHLEIRPEFLDDNMRKEFIFSDFPDKESEEMFSKYMMLTEKNKGKIDLLVEQYLQEQKEKNPIHINSDTRGNGDE